MNGLTDEEIAAAAQGGDAESFGVLVERYEAKITRYARKFLANVHDIEDIVQDVFLKAYANIKSFDAKQRFSPWLYRIAHNEFVNALKKRSRLPFSSGLDMLLPHPSAKETADGELAEREIKEMLNRSLEQLAPKYREPLVLRYFAGMEYRDIAEVLRIPVSTAGVRIHRALARLRTLYGKNDAHHG